MYIIRWIVRKMGNTTKSYFQSRYLYTVLKSLFVLVFFSCVLCSISKPIKDNFSIYTVKLMNLGYLTSTYENIDIENQMGPFGFIFVNNQL